MRLKAVPTIVDSWLSTLRPATSQDVTAWVNESWDVLRAESPAAWSAHDVNLAVMLLRPGRESIGRFVQTLDLEDESPYDEVVSLWRDFMAGTRPIVRPGLTPPEELFAVDMTFDPNYSARGLSWTAIALTDRLALFCEADDESVEPFSYPLGVITRESMFESAALLLATRAAEWREFFSSFLFFDELTTHGIPDEEVFRLLLAACGHGGRDVVHLPQPDLPAFIVPPMRHGFREVAGLLDTSRLRRKRQDGGQLRFR